MAKVNMRIPIDTLLKEKNTIDHKLQDIQNQFEVRHKQLIDLRAEQFNYREGKEALSNGVSSNAAKRVFDANIARAQLTIDEVSKQLEALEKDRMVWSSKGTAIAKSIKELQNT